MGKKFYIIVSGVAVAAVVVIAIVTQGGLLKGSFVGPLSGPCNKPLSSPVSGERGRGSYPVSSTNPCLPNLRDERTINKYIPPQVPVEKKIAPINVIQTRRR
ncbi:MAG: hypothetical protein NTX63_02860 [Candidatus Peregrinibacteria bacterium]|nr:hypothetical protein [Candidatus Peregrinibacteria bacterium]